MSGNVMEWVSDWYGFNHDASNPTTHPQQRLIEMPAGLEGESEFLAV